MGAPQPTYSQPVKEISLTRLGTAIFSALALMFSFGALVVAADNDGDTPEAVQAGAVKTSAVPSGSAIPADATPVTLKEFSFDPKHVMVNTGGVLKIVNQGAAPHTLSVDSTDLVTPELQPNDSAGLKLDSLKPGIYTLTCTVPGHKAAGMTGELMVMDGGAAQPGGMPMMNAGQMNAAQMDTMMAVRTKAFPAKTEGLGGQILPPKVLPDGTKQFDLVSKIVDWELEPGMFVKAWTYNGAVPGPTLKANPGDKVRIVIKNELPESTAIHFHGLLTPNSMDGVPDITQEPIKPGDSFTYEFVAKGPAVGMYHSHHNAVVQVPNGLAGAFLIAKDGIPLQFPYDVDTINVAPGERYTVLVTAAEPGVWAWHCHVLPHAEREDGMFGMVTAMIVN